MSPKYAGAMLGLTNTSGALAGILGVSAVGVLFDATGSWDLALIVPNIALMVVGSACFTFLGRNEPIDFDVLDDSPLAVERWLSGPRAAATALAAAVVHAVEAALPAPPPAVVEAAKKARRAARRAAQRVALATDALIHPENGAVHPPASSIVSMEPPLPGPSSRADAPYASAFQPLPSNSPPNSPYGSVASLSSFSDIVSSSLL